MVDGKPSKVVEVNEDGTYGVHLFSKDKIEEEELHRYFGRYGEVKNVKSFREHVFINFARQRDAERCLNDGRNTKYGELQPGKSRSPWTAGSKNGSSNGGAGSSPETAENEPRWSRTNDRNVQKRVSDVDVDRISGNLNKVDISPRSTNSAKMQNRHSENFDTMRENSYRKSDGRTSLPNRKANGKEQWQSDGPSNDNIRKYNEGNGNETSMSSQAYRKSVPSTTTESMHCSSNSNKLQRAPSASSDHTNEVIVANLSPDTTEQDIKKMFRGLNAQSVSPIYTTDIKYDLPFCVATFPSNIEAETAVSYFDDLVLRGRHLLIRNVGELLLRLS